VAGVNVAGLGGEHAVGLVEVVVIGGGMEGPSRQGERSATDRPVLQGRGFRLHGPGTQAALFLRLSNDDRDAGWSEVTRRVSRPSTHAPRRVP
jgi:hypothetical protein